MKPSVEKIETIKANLLLLPHQSNDKIKLSKKQSIAMLLPVIKKIWKDKYEYEDIYNIVIENGLSITWGTFIKYVYCLTKVDKQKIRLTTRVQPIQKRPLKIITKDAISSSKSQHIRSGFKVFEDKKILKQD